MCVCVCDKVPPSEREALIVQTEWLCVIMVSINLGWVGGPVRLSIHPCVSLSLSFSLPVSLSLTHTHHISTLIVTQAATEVGYFIVWRRAKGSELYRESWRVPKTFSISKPLSVIWRADMSNAALLELLTFYFNTACSRECKGEQSKSDRGQERDQKKAFLFTVPSLPVLILVKHNAPLRCFD